MMLVQAAGSVPVAVGTAHSEQVDSVGIRVGIELGSTSVIVGMLVTVCVTVCSRC